MRKFYFANGYEKNFTYIGDIGTINKTAWQALSNDTIEINFYANNSIGDIYSNTIIVRKDIKAPNITILWPIEFETFNSTPPGFIVIIRDDNLDSMWYSITDGVVNITFTQNSTINKEEWEKFSNDTIILTFYANDTVGNLAKKEILIFKIVTPPIGKKNQGIVVLVVIIGIVINLSILIGFVSLIYIEQRQIKHK